MKTIQFTESELIELKKFYAQQLEQAQKKVKELQAVIEKIEVGESKKVVKEITPKRKGNSALKKKKADQKQKKASKIPAGSKKALSTISKPSKKKIIYKKPVVVKRVKDSLKAVVSKGDKKELNVLNSKWNTFILEHFNQVKRPASLNQLVEIALDKFNLPKKDEKSVNGGITSSLFRLRKISKAIKAFKYPKQAVKYYGLSTWNEKTIKPVQFENSKIKKKASVKTINVKALKKSLKSPIKKLESKERKVVVVSPKAEVKPALNTGTTNKVADAGNAKKLSLTNKEYVNFIKDFFAKNKKPLTANDIVNAAMLEFKVEDAKRPIVRLGIARALSNFENKSKTLKTFLPKGKVRGAYYGPTEWFVGSQFKPEYAKLVK